MNRQVLIAYCLTKGLPAVRKEDIKRLDAIHIAFGLINESGEVYWDQMGTEGILDNIRKINPAIRTVLSIGGWGADGFSRAAATKEGRSRFAESAVKIMLENDMTGLDIDWEYPCSSCSGTVSSPDDKENFTLLIKELRKQLNACGVGYTLSIAAGAQESYIRRTDMKEVQKYLDYVQLMTYDFHGAFTEKTGHHANLYNDDVLDEKISADRAVSLFVEAGVPIEKIVMGAAFYGRGWIGVPPEKNGLGQTAGAGDTEDRGYDEICSLLNNRENHYRYYWDDHAKAAYIYNGDSLITYEDPRALTQKVKYVQSHHMHGMMFWEYSVDRSHTLVKHLYNEMNHEKKIS